MNTSQVKKNIRLLSLVLFLTPFFSGCEALDELDRETRERNLRNLKDWNVNSSTSEEAISEFGYENCFKIVAVEDYIVLTEDASPSYNHTFCFHFMADPVDEMHLKGLALVVNPYAPSQPTADDLCVKLFKQHGFTWGGDVQGGKRYRFEKSLG